MKYLVVDAFTDNVFRGNPAAVVFLERDVSDVTLQAIAAEFNLAETAFVRKISSGQWQLRWFTPKIEIELCGHATLASAHAIWQQQADASDELNFNALSGMLTAIRHTDKIQLNFPSLVHEPVSLPNELIKALAIDPIGCVAGHQKLLLELREPSLVMNYQPDYAAISALPYRGLIISAKCESTLPGERERFDFISRFFAPKVGIPEDPVTGAAHCMLTPYWSSKLGKQQLTAKQVSERGGILYLEQRGDRVALAGKAVTTMKGELVCEV